RTGKGLELFSDVPAMREPWNLLAAAALMCLGAASASGETYKNASVDGKGQVLITTTTGEVIRPQKAPRIKFAGEQVGIDKVQFSPGHDAIGWLALYPNCCTSYPIPLALVIFSHGRTRTFLSNEVGTRVPIFLWRFEANGSQVAFEQETVH